MLIFRFIYWKIKDILNGFKNRKNKKVHLYGIYGFFGLPGYGKTMAMSWELLELRKKYKDDIKESECYNITSIPGAKGGIILTPKEPKSPKGIELTKEEKIYLQSILTLNAFDIQRELIRLNETEFVPRRYEKVLNTLEKQNAIIESIYNKIK